MRVPDRTKIDKTRREYPKGTRIKLISMDDVQAPPKGTHGTVIAARGMGSLIMRWDNGSSLNVIPGADLVRKV